MKYGAVLGEHFIAEIFLGVAVEKHGWGSGAELRCIWQRAKRGPIEEECAKRGTGVSGMFDDRPQAACGSMRTKVPGS